MKSTKHASPDQARKKTQPEEMNVPVRAPDCHEQLDCPRGESAQRVQPRGPAPGEKRGKGREPHRDRVLARGIDSSVSARRSLEINALQR
jgi:hypothetical protein